MGCWITHLSAVSETTVTVKTRSHNEMGSHHPRVWHLPNTLSKITDSTTDWVGGRCCCTSWWTLNKSTCRVWYAKVSVVFMSNSAWNAIVNNFQKFIFNRIDNYQFSKVFYQTIYQFNFKGVNITKNMMILIRILL